MYRPPYHNTAIRHLFRGGTNANKNTHLSTTHEESGRHGAQTADSASDGLPAPLSGAPTTATMTKLCIPYAGDNCDDSDASWKLPRVLELTTNIRRLTTGDGRHVWGGATGSGCRGPLVVPAAVSVVAVLAAGSVAVVLAVGSVAEVLAAGSVAAVLAAGSVAAVLAVVLAAASVAVQVAVFSAVQVGVDVDRRCDTGPSVGAIRPSPDLPFSFWPFPTFDGCAAVLPLSPFVFPDPWVAGAFGFSLRDLGTFFTLAGGGMSLPSFRGTLAALMVGALHDRQLLAPLCLGMWWLRCWAGTWKAWP
ncbi:hypothetical protein NDU88_003856 [Pleurodeles waltl]|uniref:Uncharacterized protein n=1 Tax=Pleurodeles waltl TaxID=8319 RepID=A0AAV7UDX9_PLEWA|nr:hypothetical protein NDU88_003856 [Pleurodeles waltl]